MDRRTVLHGAGFAVALLVASGCGGGGGDSCTDECEVLDEARCYGSVIEVCVEAEDGCNAWTAQTHCEDAGQFCDDSGDAPACVFECTGGCTTEDDMQCHGSVIETCSVGSDGCLDWAPGTDCGDTGQFCDDTGTDATCVDECMDECLPVDATQCSGTVIETCAVGSDGCTDWVAGTDCSDTGEACEDGSGTAACYTPCTSDCDTELDSQCTTADWVQMCLFDEDGCLYWTDVVDCTAPGYYCDDSTGEALCISPCEDECDTEGVTACESDMIQTCTLNVFDDCLYWIGGTDCTGTGDICTIDDTSGDAVCIAPIPVLLLGDDLDTSEWDAFRTALTATGLTFDEWDLDSLSFPTGPDLAPYLVLIWVDTGVVGPGDTEHQIVVDWLALGGKGVFIIGVDFLWDLRFNSGSGGEYNLYTMLETTYSGDYSGTGISMLDGVSADPITDPFSTTGISLSGTSDSNGDYADETAGASVKAGIYGTGGSGSGHAGFTYYDGSSYKAAWLGFNFPAGMSSATEQATFIDNTLTWFGL